MRYCWSIVVNRVVQALGAREGVFHLVGVNGYDRRLGLDYPQSPGLEPSPRIGRQAMQTLRQLGMFPQEAERRERRRAGRGRDGCREDEGPRIVPHIVADRLGRRHVAAEARQRL